MVSNLQLFESVLYFISSCTASKTKATFGETLFNLIDNVILPTFINAKPSAPLALRFHRLCTFDCVSAPVFN